MHPQCSLISCKIRGVRDPSKKSENQTRQAKFSHPPQYTDNRTRTNQVICTGRQLPFQILRKFQSKIGMNEIANKFYYINNLISLKNS